MNQENNSLSFKSNVLLSFVISIILPIVCCKSSGNNDKSPIILMQTSNFLSLSLKINKIFYF